MSIRQMRQYHQYQESKKSWAEKIDDEVGLLMEQLDVPKHRHHRARYLLNSIINQEILRINSMFDNLKPKKNSLGKNQRAF